jgi:hypothetical protein
MKLMTASAALAAALLLATGCGGDSAGGAASGSSGATDTSGDGSDRGVRYAECMRENGVPDFPDPVNGRLTLRAGEGGLNPDSPEFQAAQEACRDLAPQGGGARQGGELRAQALEFAKCIRENGVPDFPDPQFSGGGVRMRLPQGVDQNSPQFQAAQQACQSLLAGAGGAP